MGIETHGPKTTLSLRFHAGQQRVWESRARFILLLAGTRSGKTAFGPWWLWREIARKGPGDYLLAAPTFKLLERAAVPYLRDALQIKLKLGRVIGGAYGHFRLSKVGENKLFRSPQKTPTRIIFGHAENPDSLEAAQYKAAWLDEVGQKQFKQQSWEAIQRRLAIDQGRALLTSTPYSLNWLKTDVWDRAERHRTGRGSEFDKDYECVSFESTMNPAFPLEEWDRAKATLPHWKFDLFYRGRFTRPAGQIYDCFDPDYHIQPAGYVPLADWKIHCGIDFGAPNFAAVFLAEEPGTKRLIAFREYRPLEAKTAAEHVAAMRKILTFPVSGLAQPVARIPEIIVGGAKSEGQWRSEFNAAGWPIREPDQPDVEVGIQRVYSAIREDAFFVTRDCPKLIEEFASYSRPVDELGNVLEGIEDQHSFHGLDSVRYIAGFLRRNNEGFYFDIR